MGPAFLNWFTWLSLLAAGLFFLHRLRCMRKVNRRLPFVAYCAFLTVLYYAYLSVFSWRLVGASALLLFAGQAALIAAFQVADPGIVNADNFRIAQLLWPYRAPLYAEKRCAHTGVPAPARSKYVRQIRRRVARFSHFSRAFGNAVGIGNHCLFLLLELASGLASLLCAGRAAALLARAARAAPRPLPPGPPLVDALYVVAVRHTAGAAVCAAFALAALAQLLALAGDTACVLANRMPGEALRMELAGARANPYDRGWRENWREALWPQFPPRPDRPVRPASLQKTV
jgi:hypothetical protein